MSGRSSFLDERLGDDPPSKPKLALIDENRMEGSSQPFPMGCARLCSSRRRAQDLMGYGGEGWPGRKGRRGGGEVVQARLLFKTHGVRPGPPPAPGGGGDRP